MYHAGVGTYLQHLVPRVVDRLTGWQFTVLVPDRRHDDLPAGCRIVQCRSNIYTAAEQWELSRVTPRDTDLFWSPHYNIPLIGRTPLVVTVHDVAHLARPEHRGFAGLTRAVYARTFLQRVRRRARAVIFVSRFSRREFERHVGAPCRATVVHNGVDAAWFDSNTLPSPDQTRPYILFVGSIKPHKNLGGLVRAFELLRTDLPHDLLIAGNYTGMRTTDTESLRAGARSDGRIRFLGRIDDAALRAYVSRAAALVFPSFYEGFGLPPLEAMAAGCPCVVSRIPAVEEVCGDAAVYCDPADASDIAAAVRRLLGDTALRDRLVHHGLERARQFTWDRAATDTAAVLTSVVE